MITIVNGVAGTHMANTHSSACRGSRKDIDDPLSVPAYRAITLVCPGT